MTPTRRKLRLLPAFAIAGLGFAGSCLAILIVPRRALAWAEDILRMFRALRTRWRLTNARAIPAAGVTHGNGG